MHGLDVDLEVRRDVPRGPDVWGQVARRERCHPAAVDVCPVWRRRWKLVSVDRSTAAHEDRPSLRIGSRLAGEVPSVELGDGGIKVVEVEPDDSNDQLVRVDFDDVEHFGLERRGANSTE